MKLNSISCRNDIPLSLLGDQSNLPLAKKKVVIIVVFFARFQKSLILVVKMWC